jgi:HSP20 family protein
MSLIPFRSLLEDPFGQDWLINDPVRDELLGGVKSAGGLDLAKAFSPLMSMDLVENENGYQVMADLPGVDAENVDLSVEGNALVMKAERNHVHETKTDKVHRLERSYGSVKRRVVLPKNADLNNANTKFSNGVLTVTVPKLPEVQPKKLAINKE